LNKQNTQERPTVTDDEIITAAEAARILKISRPTVQKYYHKGWLPGYKLGDSTSPLRLYKSGVLAFLEARKAAAPAAQQPEEPE
jgi:excisionase family DNA binding protein